MDEIRKQVAAQLLAAERELWAATQALDGSHEAQRRYARARHREQRVFRLAAALLRPPW